MPFSKNNYHHTLNGILFSCLFALSSFYLADINFIKQLGISPLVVAIILGMLYGSTLRKHLPHEWTPGIQFIAKKILRVAIVFYGFRITLQDIYQIGLEGFLIDLCVVLITMLLGTWIGCKIFKLDRDISILVSSGAAICGAAAVLATEGVLKSEPYKAAFAVVSVVLFGTIAMFSYPFLQHLGWFGFSDTQYGIYIGATVHEVAQVMVAGTQISSEAGNVGVIVKMTRVMLLAPMLIILSMVINQDSKQTIRHQIFSTFPWFAIGFILVVCLNSIVRLPSSIITLINNIDTFLLTLAMAALGIETDFVKIRAIGIKPLYLALLQFIGLMGGGYLILSQKFS